MFPQFDTQWLMWVNGHHSPMLDPLMWTVSQASTWLLLYVWLAGSLVWLYRGGKSARSWWPLVGVILAVGASVGLADWISSGVLKPLVMRPRPTHCEAIADTLHILRGYKGGAYGFPSSHAANTVAVTLIYSLLFRLKVRERGYSIISAVCLVALYVLPNCYSRMYLGVHYPLDILAGAVLGAVTATAVYLIFRAFYRKTGN